MLDILVVLQLRGFDISQRSKLVRHREVRYDLLDFRRRGWLEAYQSFQGRPRFDKLDSIVSFVGVGKTMAELEGVYTILGRRRGAEGRLPEGCPHVEWLELPYYYEMERQPGFEDLEQRVVIEWGQATRSWHQRLAPKEVVEVRPTGAFLRPFDDYLGFTLAHAELRDLYSKPDANGEWRARLSAVAGIYLILATTTGKQYVGSAYGVEGIWGRWNAYARDGHAGNKLLKELVESDAAYPSAFTYSVLQILPPTYARDVVLESEALYKKKLGSRAIGLNEN